MELSKIAVEGDIVKFIGDPQPIKDAKPMPVTAGKDYTVLKVQTGETTGTWYRIRADDGNPGNYMAKNFEIVDRIGLRHGME